MEGPQCAGWLPPWRCCREHAQGDAVPEHGGTRRQLQWILDSSPPESAGSDPRRKEERRKVRRRFLARVRCEREKCVALRDAANRDVVALREYRHAVRDSLRTAGLDDLCTAIPLGVHCDDDDDERADVDRQDLEGKTMLHNIILKWAETHGGSAGSRYERLAAAALVAGAGLEIRDRLELTPLTLAVKMGAVEIARLLSFCGADLHAVNMQSFHPLLLAAERDQLPTFAFLCREIKRRAPPKSTTSVEEEEDVKKQAAPSSSPENDEDDDADDSSDADSDDADNSDDFCNEREMLARWRRERRKDALPLAHYAKYTGNGYTVLHFAVVNNSPRLLRKALTFREYQTVVDALSTTDTTGMITPSLDGASVKHQTALHKAVAYGHAACVRALLEAGADPNKIFKLRDTPRDAWGHKLLRTDLPLHAAVLNNDHACTRLLLANGCVVPPDLDELQHDNLDNHCVRLAVAHRNRHHPHHQPPPQHKRKKKKRPSSAASSSSTSPSRHAAPPLPSRRKNKVLRSQSHPVSWFGLTKTAPPRGKHEEETKDARRPATAAI